MLMVINRVKNMLGYPEARAAMLHPNSVLYRSEQWGLGKRRSLEGYLRMVGIDSLSKQVQPNQWCHDGVWPTDALPYRIRKR